MCPALLRQQLFARSDQELVQPVILDDVHRGQACKHVVLDVVPPADTLPQLFVPSRQKAVAVDGARDSFNPVRESMKSPENETLLVIASPSPFHRFVWDQENRMLHIPPGWECLKPGDAAVTKAVKSLGPSWTATRKKGRKTISYGVWAPAEHIEEAQRMVAEKRAAPGYAKKRESDLKRRDKKQTEYVASFTDALLKWLNFHTRYLAEAERMATLICEHAIPVGSGTVARTERIPIEDRAAAAAIAWMRHQTTGYDTMRIALVKGRRREVRRELAQRSRALLSAYRRGNAIDRDLCPLARALRQADVEHG